MKRINLLTLSLRNFKGIRNFTLDTRNGNVSVYADNAIGKTTIFDSFIWLLFDKDSQNRSTSNFAIKTLDADGNEMHNLEHEVEGAFEIDGKKLTLRKVYTEKWTQKRGSASQEFTGHTTDYYINGVPSKKKEYTDRVDSMVQEDIFKLLTSPSYFNEQVKWQDRRSILLDICGDVSDEDVIASSRKLAKLPDILGDHSIEEHRKVIAAKRSHINKEIDKIPVRIDEVQRSMPDLSGLDEAKITKEIDILTSRIEEKESEISRIQSGGEISAKEKQLRETESEQIRIKNEVQSGVNEKVQKKQQELSRLKQQADDTEYEIRKAVREIQANEADTEKLKLELDQLREKWKGINADTFESQHDENCPTCGQALPEEQVKTAHEKAMAAFNQAKADRLEANTTQGKATADRIKELHQEKETMQGHMSELQSSLKVQQMDVELAKTELNRLQGTVKDVDTDSEYIKTKQEAQKIQDEIRNLRSSIEVSISKARNDRAELKTNLERCEKNLSAFGRSEQAKARIEQLKAEEKDLAAEFERLEEELYLTEEFIRTKVQLLEERINSKFKSARFKLFAEQINGGLTEVCETTYEGVPYSSGLNNAARINVGLDIISTLSEHYGITAPIFIDNREAVTRLIETNSQLVSLIVSEPDKELRVEHESKSMREAV